MKQRFYPVLAVIVLVAACLRLVDLGGYPQRFNQDEMAQGYDAWSIWRTGHDQHGEPFPLEFRNFNDYIPPVANYLTAPFVGLLGMDETTTRLPVALFSIMTVALVGLLGRLWFGEAAGLAAALLLTFEPWNINYSRIAYPASFVPFFTVAALYTYTRGINLSAGEEARQWRHSLYWLAASALSFAILMATYSTMKLEAPLLIVACALAGIPLWRRNWRLGLIWLALVALFASPYVVDQLIQWQLSQGRFDGISIFSSANWSQLLWKDYRSYYDLQALFVDGLKGGIAVHPAGIGELFWLEAPLMLIALVGLCRPRFWRNVQLWIPVLLIIWFLIFPIAASLTDQDVPHEVRSYNLLPLPELLAGYGIALIWEFRREGRWRRTLSYLTLAATLIVFILFNATFLTYFLGPSPLNFASPDVYGYENIGLRPVLEKVQSVAQTCDLIWMDRTAQETYMYYLFMTRTPPEQFQQARIEENTNLWLDINWFNNVRFGAPYEAKIDAPPTPDCDGQPSNTYFVTRRPTLPQGWQDIIVIRNDTGGILWRAAIRTA